MKLILFFIFLFILSLTTFSQQSKNDSLLSLIKTDKEDTNKVNHLNALSKQYWLTSDYNNAKQYANNALLIAQKLNYKAGIANACNIIGNVYWNQGDYAEALKSHFTSLSIREAINDQQGIARSLNNIGLIYWNQGDYPKAIEFHFKALKIREKIGDKDGIATSLNNIGLIYYNQSDYPKALEFYFKSVKIKEGSGDQQGIATLFMNIGNIYADQRIFSKALEYHFKALKIREDIGDKVGVASSLNNIGINYWNQGDLRNALDYYLRSLKIEEEVEDKQGIATTLNNIGLVYLKQKKKKEALEYCQKSLVLAKEIGELDYVKEAEKALNEIYEQLQDNTNALKHYKAYIVVRDSLMNKENTKKTLQQQMQYEFDKKEAATKAEQDKKDAVTTAEKQRQKIITYSVSVGLLLVLLLALFILRGYKQKQKTNQELSEKNTVIAEQKKLVEEKNKDITDSINYAKRIQEAFLIPESEIKKQFADAFVFFKPKDIVSGDIYWFVESKYNKVLVVADCTGHGVPGGFMSMLSFAMLQETLLLEEVKTTAQALTYLDHKITETLNRNNRSYRDGMDMTLCAFSKSTNTLQFSCANRPLILIRNGELKEFSPDKFTIGGAIDNVSKNFRNQEIQIESGDMIYLFTDGYVDQFGGQKGKKFKHKQLNEKLLAISNQPLANQKEILEQTFNDWKGTLEQVDDVCIIGIKTCSLL